MQTKHGSILRPYTYRYYSFSTLPFYPQMSFGVIDPVMIMMHGARDGKTCKKNS